MDEAINDKSRDKLIKRTDLKNDKNRSRRKDRSRSPDSSDDDDDSEDDRRRGKSHNRKRKKSSKRKSKSTKHHRRSRSKSKSRKRSDTSSSSSDSSSSSSSSSSSTSRGRNRIPDNPTVGVNNRLLTKLAARGETLEERKARRSQRRALRIQATLGYTADDNPFNDPNLHETFSWKKRDAKIKSKGSTTTNEVDALDGKKNTLDEIEKVRQRRKDRELQFEELERIRAEEARMKELENYDEWARKEEEFHLQQQRQRSAIRLVEGREKPIDVLAKNILLFGLSDEENEKRSAIKYQEKYNVLDAVADLEAELEEPQVLLRMLKLNELEMVVEEIQAFQKLERDATSFSGTEDAHDAEHRGVILQYWDNLRCVAEDEIKLIKTGGAGGKHSEMVHDVKKIFEGGQSVAALYKMKAEIDSKLQQHTANAAVFGDDFDRDYWLFVRNQLIVHLAKVELSELHSKMLVRQLEKLEKRREELRENPAPSEQNSTDMDRASYASTDPTKNENNVAGEIENEFGDLEEELGLAAEHDFGVVQRYNWQDKYRPRKPRYFNRVKSGYDWNKYNQTHYDKDNPPPKTVQGYKFNVFYPDLINPNDTPTFKLEPTNSDDFCIIRFIAGPPYEDVAFKIVNREWNRSRKRGFKCTFERGVLSLYFNFTTYWYRK